MSTNENNFIEKRTLSEDMKAFVFATAVADIELLASADFLIGTSASTVTRLIFLSMVGRLGYVPPFVFVDGRPIACEFSIFCPSGPKCGCLR